MNISSVVIQTGTEQMEAVLRKLKSFSWCDVHFTEESGKIVVTIEGNDATDATEKVRQLQALKDVFSADPVYFYED
ncbi:MAG: chaperone NapD [FCB group bacterium]|nr:chaperone NapD [FCB group bacterium]